MRFPMAFSDIVRIGMQVVLLRLSNRAAKRVTISESPPFFEIGIFVGLLQALHLVRNGTRGHDPFLTGAVNSCLNKRL
jgi:hypothetical protein